MKIRTVVVDDEKPIVDEIVFCLREQSDIEVIGAFTNGLDALTFIAAEQPRLVFLDIQMPGLSGLEVAEKLSALRQPPLIVFLTAFGQHALEAFSTPAVGYITKPLTEDKFDKAMAKIRSLVPTSQETQASTSIAGERLCVMANGKIIPLERQHIVFAYVKEKEVYVRTHEAEYYSPLTLQEIDEQFQGSGFLRVHRQFLVNLSQIKEIIPWFHGAYLLRMNDAKQEEVPVSRSNVKTLKSYMGLK